MSENLPTAESDPPIIVQGGGSIDVQVPDGFNQQPTGNGKNFKNDKVNLVSLQIDEQTPIPLNKNARITIIYK